MKNQITITRMLLVATLLTGLAASPVRAGIDGVTGTSFTLTAKADTISIPEGSRPLVWGYAWQNGLMQYPGPTLIVNQGARVTVTLKNSLNTNVSIIFPGQSGVTAVAAGGTTAQGLLTLEAAPGGAVQYQFTAAQPGTYLYHSGTRPDLQIEMGLVGALIVRPTVGGVVKANHAYDTMDAMYDVEYLFLLTEMDPHIHQLVQDGRIAEVDTTGYFPKLWFINGRCAPDTMADAFAPWLPTQPYNCMPMMEPGQLLLMRVASPGRDQHPFHFHGNHARLIARDGRMLSSGPGRGADLATALFTIQTVPGGTADAVFTWSGQGLGWDIYGHKPGDPMLPGELASDHGKPFPVLLPDLGDQQFGAFYSGSPFLGMMGALPASATVMNPRGDFVYMWHSHTEKEMVNDDIFPGGMMTMLMIHAPGMMPGMGKLQAASQGR